MASLHVPVLVDRVVELLAPAAPGLLVDATVGLGGHSGIEAGEFYFDNSLYFAYKNLFGNKTSLLVEIPFYRNQGVMFFLQGDVRRIRYTLDLEYAHSTTAPADSLLFYPGLSYGITPLLFLGADILVNNAVFNSFGAYPFIEIGSRDRRDKDSRSWYFISSFPKTAMTFNGSSCTR